MAKKGGLYVYQQIAKTKAEWEAENPIVPDRVLIWETDTLVVKIGDGKTHYNDLLDRMTSGKAPRVSEETDNWQIWNVITRQWDDTGICSYPGKAPRINQGSQNWEVWDGEKREFTDTGICAYPGKSPRVNPETCNWEVWNDEKREYADTLICAYPGKAPRINPETENWENWNDEQRKYVDTGIYAKTPGAPRISSKNTWETWDPDTRQYKDSGLGVVLATNIDGGKPSSVYTPDQVINFGKVKR